MSWFDEQLKYRKQTDEDNFADAIGTIAGAVMGKRLTEAFDNREIAKSAIDEVLRYYKFKSKSDDMPPQIKTLDEQIDYRMRPFGIMKRKVTLEGLWWKDAAGAMLGTLKSDGSAVALIPGKFSGYTYRDFKSGKRIRINRRTEKLLDTEAICFYKPLPMKSLKMSDLLKFSLAQLNAADIVSYVGAVGLSALVGLLAPMFTKWLFGTVLESGSTRVLAAIASYMLCYIVAQTLVTVYRNISNERVGAKQNIALQAAVMNRVISLPPSFFKDYSSGELAQRTKYTQLLPSIVMQTVGSLGLTSVFSLIYIAQIFAFAPALVAPSIVITLLTVAVMLITTFVQMRVTKEKMLISSKTSGMTYSLITGIQKIKLAGAEKRMFSRWAREYSKEASLEYNPPAIITVSETVNLAITLLGTLVLYYLALKSHVGVADYYAFNSAYGMVSGAFVSFANIAVALANIKPILEMAKPIMEAEPELSDGRQTVTSLKGHIELSDVYFRYDDKMPNVIDGLSLKIEPGEYVAIVGTTGCGKSTLMRLLLGFEKPQKGSICYDGKEIGSLDVRMLRRKIGAVMQDSKLFLGDIYSNIVISAPELTVADAWEAAEKASVADDIRDMPMGMHTLISEGQGGISGGQKQRLIIARALAPNPKILMFDEATSALDNITQKKVSDAIDALNCTRIVIAHRLSTIRHCDRIIVLDKGRISESGTYEELLEKNGLFAELVKRQRLDIDESEAEQ